jgi:hypothetical protein
MSILSENAAQGEVVLGAADDAARIAVQRQIANEQAKQENIGSLIGVATALGSNYALSQALHHTPAPPGQRPTTQPAQSGAISAVDHHTAPVVGAFLNGFHRLFDSTPYRADPGAP